MADWPSGVTVVTTADEDGRPWGFTATSFTSLSMNPPMILVCLAVGAECRRVFERSHRFAVHILGSEQAELARRFATRGADKFAGLRAPRGVGDVPLIEGAVARLECRATERVAGGDHIVLIGTVHRVALGEAEPLVYHRRAFHRLPSAVRPQAA